MPWSVFYSIEFYFLTFRNGPFGIFLEIETVDTIEPHTIASSAACRYPWVNFAGPVQTCVIGDDKFPSYICPNYDSEDEAREMGHHFTFYKDTESKTGLYSGRED